MRVTYNQGDQRISIVPIHPSTGQPVLVDSGSDVTVSIVDLRETDSSDDHEVLATTTISQDAFSQALTAAAGYSQADPHNIPVDASSAALGRTYVLIAADGTSEAVQLRAVGGSTSASTTYPLRGNYAAADTLRGVELVATFPAAEANDEDSVESRGGPYLVTWTYVVDGQTVVMPTELWVDRHSIAPTIDDAWVLRGSPDMAHRGRSYVSSAILAAWDDWLATVQAHGEDPSRFLASHVARVGLRKLALAYMHRWASGGAGEDARADELEKAAHDMFASELVGQGPQGQVKLTRDEVSHDPHPKGHILGLS